LEAEAGRKLPVPEWLAVMTTLPLPMMVAVLPSICRMPCGFVLKVKPWVPPVALAVNFTFRPKLNFHLVGGLNFTV
jgi:hypothetical protein